MVGARSDDEVLFYPVSEGAPLWGERRERDGLGDEAYARFFEREAARPDFWCELPWA
jgi:hypothetical protein